MTSKYKHSKRFKYNKPLSHTLKLKGGENSAENDSHKNDAYNAAGKEESQIQSIHDQVSQENDISKVLGINVLKQLVNVTKGIAVGSIELAGKFADVNFFDPYDLNNKLDKIIIVMTDEKTKENAKKLIKQYVDYGVILIEASSPFVNQMVAKGAVIAEESMSKVGESSVEVLFNTMIGIPGIGMILGGVKSMNKIGTLFLSVINANAEMMTLGANASNASLKNMKRLLNSGTTNINSVNNNNPNTSSNASSNASSNNAAMMKNGMNNLKSSFNNSSNMLSSKFNQMKNSSGVKNEVSGLSNSLNKGSNMISNTMKNVKETAKNKMLKPDQVQNLGPLSKNNNVFMKGGATRRRTGRRFSKGIVSNKLYNIKDFNNGIAERNKIIQRTTESIGGFLHG
tara:strand:+ start:2349 stop:3542 length:1194 start_codon:yes stop_codon:yes gene_type:complete